MVLRKIPRAPAAEPMPVLEYRPSSPLPSDAIRRLFVTHNPFFLLSGLSMLFGIFALNNSLTFSPLPQNNLLLLILMLNAYELLLVGLGIFLIRRGRMRDGATLLVLEAVFLSDCGFLNSEIFTADLTTGAIVNACLLILIAVKLGFVFRGLGLSWRRDVRFIIVIGQLLFLMLAPGYFRYEVNHHNGVLFERTICGVWWLLGMMVAFSTPLLSRVKPAHQRLIGCFIFLPIISIIAHLCTAGWVYHVPWHWDNFTPLILGLAIVIGTSDHHVHHLTARMRLHLILPIIAILFSLENPAKLSFTLGSVTITSIRSALIGAMIVHLLGLLVHRHPSFLVAAAMEMLMFSVGRDQQTLSKNTVGFVEICDNVLHAIVPRTLQGWGMISVIAAFLLLGVGLFFSLRKTVEPPD